MARGSSLRARVQRVEQDAARVAVLGEASANAYFSARRLRRASGAKKRAADDEIDESSSAAPAAPPKRHKLTVQPRARTTETLRHVDAHEDAWRRRRKPWPSFEPLYARWLTQLHAGFSVLLHGVGSKHALLESFASSLPRSAYVVHVHGYLPDVALREVVDLLQLEVFDIPSAETAKLSMQSFAQQCRGIVDFAFDHRQQPFPRVYVVVHSLDGAALRNPDLQAGLARLSMAPTVHLVASVDSVNAPGLWNEDVAQRFRWLHHRVDTLRPYLREVDLRFSREGKAAERALSGVFFILQSLTPTDVGTLRLIAQHQLGRAAAKEAAGPTRGRPAAKYADYQTVYAESRKLLLHATMQSLKNSLKCLEDNGLVRVIRVKNAEKLTIPLADDLIEREILAPAKETKAK